MFCYQCQETAKGTGCTTSGVCGKQAPTADAMDTLLFVTRGTATVAHLINKQNVPLPPETYRYVCDALFSTITNANFDTASIEAKTQRNITLRNKLKSIAQEQQIALPQVAEITMDSTIDISKNGNTNHGTDEDISSLQSLITFGLKGIAAYLEHARNLGMTDNDADSFVCTALATLTLHRSSVKQLFDLALSTGDTALRAMALLDKANTQHFGNPVITKVQTSSGYRSGILVSGHDLHDLEMLLQQSQRQNIDIYTHGEMLPAHYYPLLKKYNNLVGNYGGAWWKQREEFCHFNGPILFTSNCIVPPLVGSAYENRIFTTNSAGYPGWHHIETKDNGEKDFSPIIDMAHKCAPPQPLPPTAECETDIILGGFAHNQVEQVFPQLLAAVEEGKITQFVVMAGCDGRAKSREYYTHYAKSLPHSTIILTAGCAKYRYNRLNLGDIDGIPRVLDAGQCNDCYSLVRIALKLQKALNLKHLNELPITYNIAWYEQKAVAVLLALLSLGIKNICIGPTLPAFLSPNIRNVLIGQFGLTTPDLNDGIH